jgi:gas vesicle protein
LINEFWEELKKKDDQYSKTLKNQSKDIKELVSKMRDQYFALRDQSLMEL